MQQNHLKLFSFQCLLPIFLLLSTIVNGQIDFTSIHYRGIRPDDRNGLLPIHNPGRGFRLEDAIDLSNPANSFFKGSDLTIHLKSEALKYAADSITLVQTTLFLPAAENKPIADSVLKNMQIYFDTLRSMGLKSLLRLTCATQSGNVKNPRPVDILNNLDQLQQLLLRNKDVLLGVQAGFFRSEVEVSGSKSKYEYDKNAKVVLIRKLLSVVPVPLQIQVRLPEDKNLLPVDDPDYDRVGFYDELVVGKPDKIDGGLHEGTPPYEQIVRESTTSMVDGSLPPGFWSLVKGGFLIDGLKAASRFRLQHFSSLSVMRNNREDGGDKKYSMEVWKNMPIGPEELMAEKMPYTEDYFTASSGNIVRQSIYDYIRDHLGYRIELQQLMLPVKRSDNSPIHLKLELINRGFSTVRQSCSVAFVLIDPTGKVYELPAEGDPNSWQPFVSGDLNYKPLTHLVQYQGKLPLHLMPGRYKLGVWIADVNTGVRYDYRYAIRCANGNVGWWISRDGRYGINVLTNLTISK